ncbi:MAG: hypothetical protein FJW38_02590 [Acidobacteria bacterium]|nr:hypothetical protein [Acidobacteriota bacterium]
MRHIRLAHFSAALCFGLEPDGDSVILYPPPGSVLPGNTVTFTWEHNPTIIEYDFSIGSQPNSLTGDIFYGPTTGLSYTVSKIPCNGQTFHLTLRSRYVGSTSTTPFTATYTAPTNCGPDPRATILSPSPGNTLFNNSATFSWNAPASAIGYWLDVGTARGIGDISAGFQTTNTRTVTLRCVPWSTVWVRLWTRTASGYLDPVDFTYLDSFSCVSPFSSGLVTPARESRLPGSTVTFTWTQAPGAIDYFLNLGTIHGQGNIWAGSITGTSVTITADFCAGSAFVHAQITPRYATGYYGASGYRFVPPLSCGASAKGQITAPIAQTVINGSAQFTWSAGLNAIDYWLDVGPGPGNGLYFAGTVAGVTKNVAGIPCDGRTVWVRLWTRNAAGYLPPIDYSYTAATSCGGDPRATFISPASGSALPAASQIFSWTTGTAALDYWLDVGTSVGIGNIAAGIVRSTQIEVFGLPCNGQQLFARL